MGIDPPGRGLTEEPLPSSSLNYMLREMGYGSILVNIALLGGCNQCPCGRAMVNYRGVPRWLSLAS
jgi:hypothetical protein